MVLVLSNNRANKEIMVLISNNNNNHNKDIINLIYKILNKCSKDFNNNNNRIYTNSSNNKWCINNNKECNHKWVKTLEWCRNKTWDILINNHKICSNKCHKCLSKNNRRNNRMLVRHLILISETFIDEYFSFLKKNKKLLIL